MCSAPFPSFKTVLFNIKIIDKYGFQWSGIHKFWRKFEFLAHLEISLKWNFWGTNAKNGRHVIKKSKISKSYINIARVFIA